MKGKCGLKKIEIKIKMREKKNNIDVTRMDKPKIRI